MGEVIIREIQLKDNEAVAQVVRQVLVDLGVPKVGTAYADKALDDMYGAYDVPKATYFVAEEAGHIIGCAGIAQLDNFEGNVCELQKMYFLEAARGKGLGAKMIDACLTKAKEYGFEACYLETMPYMKAAQKLYQKNGFEYIDAPMGNTGHYSCPVWMLKKYKVLLQDIKDIFHKELDKIYQVEEVDSFFYAVIEHYLNLERFVLVLQPNLSLTKEEEEPLFKALAELKLEKPLQYVLGIAHFMDLELRVSNHVLIPRPETEELVEWILSNGQVEHGRGLKILDIGTGSGCIAITLAKKFPNAAVYALDVSEKALDVAKENAALNHVEVTFIHDDILDLDLELKFDIIISNPPYVRELEKREIRDNVKKYEPHVALFVKDEAPLVFYKAITQFAHTHLEDHGHLYFEINQYLGNETRKLLEEHNFLEIELRKDMFGNDRMLKGKLS